MVPRTFLNTKSNGSEKIRLLTFVIIFLAFFLDNTKALKCYKCQVAESMYRDKNTTKLCSKFNEYDEDFIVDCPYSTMCLKKIHVLLLNSGESIETVTRDCANQRYRDQVYKQGGWREEHKIEEPYQEGCKDLDSPQTASTNTYCHCRGKLCNSASKDTVSYHTDAMAVIFVFNAVRYLNSGLAYY